MNPIVQLILSLLLTFAAQAQVKIPTCSAKSDLAIPKSSISVESLSGLILVGIKATYSVESLQGNFKVVSEQSFKSGKSRIICGGGDFKDRLGFSIYAPTLLNFKSSPAVASIWQFQLTADKQRFGIWNRKSRLMSQSKESWKESLEKQGYQIVIHQLSRNLYDVYLTKESDKYLENIVLRYDVLTEL